MCTGLSLDLKKPAHRPPGTFAPLVEEGQFARQQTSQVQHLPPDEPCAS